MTDAVARKPRNTRLSAYYNLQSTPEQHKPESSSTSFSEIPSNREQALQYATHLTQTLPLSDLLQRCTQLRLSSEELQHSLHSSTRRYYQHLDATSIAARSCAEQADSLRPSTEAVVECAKRAKGVNDRLEAARSEVDKLEGARRATLLQSAANQLTSTLLPAYRELADLCTDPTAARDRLFLCAQRAAVVLPAVEQLAPHSEDFNRAAGALREAMKSTRDEIALRGEVDDPYGLAIHDAMHLRRLLGDNREALINAFCSLFARRLSADAPSEAARAATGPNALAQGRLHLEFARDRVLPKAFTVGDNFAHIFVTTPDDTDVWHAFIVWLSDVLDDAIAARVRRALSSKDSDKLGDADEARRFFSAVDGLLAASSAAVKQRDENDSGGSHRAAKHIDEVLQAIGTDLKSRARDVLAANAAAVWQSAVNDFMLGTRGTDVVDDIIRAVQEGCEQEYEGDGKPTKENEIEVLEKVALYSWKVAALTSEVPERVRAGVLLREIDKRYKRGSISGPSEMVSRLFESIREDVVEKVQDSLRTRMDELRRLRASTSERTTSEEVENVIKLLAQVGRAGQEHSVEVFRSREREDELLGGNEGLVSGVARMWTEMVREISFASEAGVHALQIDACEIGIRVDREYAFDGIGRAALERCCDRGAVALSKEQVHAEVRKRQGTEATEVGP